MFIPYIVCCKSIKAAHSRATEVMVKGAERSYLWQSTNFPYVPIYDRISFQSTIFVTNICVSTRLRLQYVVLGMTFRASTTILMLSKTFVPLQKLLSNNLLFPVIWLVSMWISQFRSSPTNSCVLGLLVTMLVVSGAILNGPGVSQHISSSEWRVFRVFLPWVFWRLTPVGDW